MSNVQLKLEKVAYDSLNSRQKENFNFQKASAVLADYGFVTFRLSDDWQGADFIALQISGEVLRVQLKTRLGFYNEVRGQRTLRGVRRRRNVVPIAIRQP